MSGKLSAHTVVQFVGDGTKNWGFSYTVDPKYANGVYSQGEVFYYRVSGRDAPDGNWVEIQSVDLESPTYNYLRSGEFLLGKSFDLYVFPQTQWSGWTGDPLEGDVSVTVGKGNIEVLGSAKADTWHGTMGANDTIYGYGGKDTLSGGKGKDFIDGGTGSDTLSGGDGDDTLIGGTSGDVLNGGAGIDAASYSTAKQGVIASFSKPSVNTGDALGDSYIAIENLIGSRFADKLVGNAAVNHLSGGFGDDRLEGRDGDDILYGDSGADDLYGGAGKDTFVYKSVSQSTLAVRDTIFDFAGDKIDLSAIDANTKTSGNQSFTFVGLKAFSGKSGELRYDKKTSDTYIYADVDGDKKIDFSIHLDDLVQLSSGYFVL